MATQPYPEYTGGTFLNPGYCESQTVANMFKRLFNPDKEGALAIKAYHNIVAARFKECLQDLANDPVPKELSQYDIDHLTDPDAEKGHSQKYGIKKRSAKEAQDSQNDANAAKAMNSSEKAIEYDCSLCGQLGRRHTFLPMAPEGHIWRDHIRVCFNCARGYSSPPGNQPARWQYTGWAIDDGPGSDSLMANRFPDTRPDTPMETWSSAIPQDLEIKNLCKSKSFTKARFVLRWQWDPYMSTWTRNTYRPDLADFPLAQLQAAKDAWKSDCNAHWDMRRHMLVARGRRARGSSWREMVDYFRRLYPHESNKQRAILAAKRTAVIVHATMANFESVDHQTKTLVLRVFSVHAVECEIIAMDIRVSLHSIHQSLLGHTYALGMITKIMSDINQEWLCRQPDCSNLIKATQWLRNVEGNDIEEIINEHGHFWCPKCAKMYKPWVDMPGADPDVIKANAARQRMNEGKWDHNRLIPANKAYLVKNSIGPGAAGENTIMGLPGSSAGATFDQHGNQWLVFLCEWPDLPTEAMINRLQIVSAGLASNPPKSAQELAISIHHKALTDDKNKAVEWQHAVMAKPQIDAIELRNYGAKKPVRLDLAKDPSDGMIHFDFLPVQFQAGQTTVMHMDEQIEMWLLIKTSLFAAAESIQRSST